MDKKLELKGLLRELMDEETAKKEIAKKDEAYAKLLEENKALKELEEKRKNAKGKNVKLNTPTGESVDFIYKGWDLRNQCADLTIASEETKNEIAKFSIDMITKASLGEGNTGAYLVPDSYENTIMALARLQSIALQECRIFNISRDVLKIPVESTNTAVDIQAFGTANTESDPVLSQITLDMKRIGNYSEIYNDLLEDSVFDISSWLASMGAEAIGMEIDNNVLGSGTGFTGNALTDAGSTVTVGTSASTIADLSYNHFSLAVAELSENQVGGAKFYMNKIGAHYVRTQKDDNNRPIFQLPTADNAGQLYGYDVRLSDKITGAPATTDPFVLFGNLKNYALGIRKGMEFQINPYIKMKEGISQFILSARVDGDALMDSSFVNIAIG